jgi:hypothetical protein
VPVTGRCQWHGPIGNQTRTRTGAAVAEQPASVAPGRPGRPGRGLGLTQARSAKFYSALRGSCQLEEFRPDSYLERLEVFTLRPTNGGHSMLGRPAVPRRSQSAATLRLRPEWFLNQCTLFHPFGEGLLTTDMTQMHCQGMLHCDCRCSDLVKNPESERLLSLFFAASVQFYQPRAHSAMATTPTEDHSISMRLRHARKFELAVSSDHVVSRFVPFRIGAITQWTQRRRSQTI